MGASLTFPRNVTTTLGQEVDPCTQQEFLDLLAQGLVKSHKPSKEKLDDSVTYPTPYAPKADETTDTAPVAGKGE